MVVNNINQEVIRYLYNKGYRGTEDGRFINPRGKELKTKAKSNHKYAQSQVWFQGVRYNYHFHRVVAYQLFGEKLFEDGMVVRHLNGNPLDNSWENLALGTNSENEQDKKPEDRTRVARIANSKRKNVNRYSMRRFTDDQVREIRERNKNGETGASLAIEYGVSKDALYQIFRGVTYKDVT